MLSRDLFKTPSNSFRPFQIVHGFNFMDSFDREEKLSVITSRLNQLKSLGFGGIVTNVAFENYLEDEENWSLFKETVEIAKKIGLRLWIYDEKGYPSGTAGGLTLKGHPEFEALGIIGFFHMLQTGDQLYIEHPRGHGDILSVVAYKGDSFDTIDISCPLDLSEYLSIQMDLKWKATEGKWFVCYIVTKPLFEGTHAARNYTEIKRYVNLLDKMAVKRFIEVTYEAYNSRVGKYFGNYIEAFFTDEPSLIPEYWPTVPDVVSPVVVDELDNDMKLYPTIAWHRSVFDEFKKRRGYDLKSFIPFLFGGKIEIACQTRWDFRKTITEMFEEAYYKQLHDFCEGHNIAFSGHVLYEQDLKMHTPLEGNFFSLLKHMHYPGLDMLYSTPEKIMEKLVIVPKLISSIAHLNGRKHVMSETSAVFDEFMDKVKVGINEMKCSIAIQYALGVDTFTSYYSDNALSIDEYKEFCGFTGRIGEVLSNGEHVAQVALYYPIESMSSYNLPSDKHITENEPVNKRGFTDEEIECDNGWKMALYTLLNNQMDFDVIDSKGVISCQIDKSKMITPQGEKFEVLVIPPTKAIELELLEKLETAIENDFKLVLIGFSLPVGLKGSNSEDIIRRYKTLLNQKNVIVVNKPEELVITLNRLIEPDVKLNIYMPQVIYLHKKVESSNVYLFVNTSKEKLDFNCSVKCSGKVSIWNPNTGCIEALNELAFNNNRTSFQLILGRYEALIVIFNYN